MFFDIILNAKHDDWLAELHYKGPLEDCDTQRWAHELHHKLVEAYADPLKRLFPAFHEAEKYYACYRLFETDDVRSKCYTLHMCSKSLQKLNCILQIKNE